MTPSTLLTLLLVITLTALAVRLVLLIRADGRGRRPAPRSHRDWTEGVPGVPPR